MNSLLILSLYTSNFRYGKNKNSDNAFKTHIRDVDKDFKSFIKSKSDLVLAKKKFLNLLHGNSINLNLIMNCLNSSNKHTFLNLIRTKTVIGRKEETNKDFETNSSVGRQTIRGISIFFRTLLDRTQPGVPHRNQKNPSPQKEFFLRQRFFKIPIEVYGL